MPRPIALAAPPAEADAAATAPPAAPQPPRRQPQSLLQPVMGSAWGGAGGTVFDDVA
jgi:hypothetical protein